MNIRFMTDDDLQPAAGILELSFGGGRRLDTLRLLREMQFDGWLCAECDSQLVGMVMSIDYGPFAHLGMMGVRPDYRRQGIARALMGALLDWLDERDCPQSILDASEMGKSLYEQVGFVSHDLTVGYQLHQRSPLAVQIPVEPVREADLLDLIAFDEPIFGARREQVLRVLWEHFSERAFLTRDIAGNISGYVFAQGVKIGPWAALDPQAGETLLASVMDLPFEDIPTILVPHANQHATNLVERAGFIRQRVLPHMSRPGLSPLPGQRSLLYAQVSYAIG